MNLLNTVLLIAKEVGYKSLIAELLHGLGNVYYDKREYDKALDFFRERLSIEKKLGNQSGIAFTLANIGKAFIKKGMIREPLPYTEQACIILHRLGHEEEKVNLQNFIKNSIENSLYENN